jgi:putative peptidoglycan lipid II flippase
LSSPPAPTGSTAGASAGVGGRRFVRANLAVAAGTLTSRVTGLLRIAALAYAVGTTLLADSFNLANTAPNIVYELLLGGVLSAALTPMLAGHVERRDDAATRAVVGTSISVLVGLTVLAVLAAPLFVRLYVSPSDPAWDDTVFLARLLFPQILFYGLSAIGTSLLNARRSFFAPAWAPVLNNVVAIVVFVWVGRILAGGDLTDGDRTTVLWLLGAGSTLGIVVMAGALWPSLRQERAPIGLLPDWNHPEVRRLLRLSAWTMGYVAANQLAVLVVYRLAWQEGVGALSTYLYAFQFFVLPHGLVAVTLITTLAPELATAHTRGDERTFARQAALGIRLVALLTLPAAVLFLVVPRPILSIFLERGLLGEQSVAELGAALAALAVGLVPFSLYLFALRCFYARGDARTPFVINVVENLLNIVLAVPLTAMLGVEGLALAFALAYALSAGVAVAELHRRLGRWGGHLTAGVTRLVVAAAVATVAAWLGSRLGGDGGLGAVVRVLAAGLLTVVAYLGTLRVLALVSPPGGRRVVAGDASG